MEYYITIPGRLDNLNDYINACRSNRAYGNKIKEINQDFCKVAIFDCIGKTKIKPPVYIEYHWYEKDRRRDLDNISSFGRKVFQDALVEVGALPGDGWRQIVGFSDKFYIDQENPRVEVVIREVESGRAYHDPEKNSGMGMV